MKKYKKCWLTLGVLLVLCLIGYLFLSVVPRHKANESVDDYLAAQKVESNQIKTRTIQKDWTQGGYYITIVFKDDPDLVYEYNYNSKRDLPYHIFVDAYKNGSGQTEDNMKHPPLQEQLEDMNKSK
ncbi:DUF3139 domain-containing protein [Listeria monocytogenes]|uniref:DUF3139 domain-containing protein n=1 Tax=Listeria monocytogenes TaxID=1639 RepID=UPI00087423FF|nr:DUF3139 domain-containing protein [Listeria monocytogenes]EAC8350546.1 DUF3139 domain-containing protein [Listeria monocytogenes]EAD0740473.1 DUF3139 domain-containing protein [Listeria monocytogenes]EAD9140645.1 DUF3139 domain-containing protein [Listeria monocytogenes]EIL9239364.1 DUF3139 domain-containing protein [Listeria monocytogenes]MCM64173.1 DUF3139 domain-containing protein [Listeria monocytogenes]